MGDEARIAGLRAALEVAPGDTMLRRLLVDALEGAGRWSEGIVERLALMHDGAPTVPDKVALAHAYAEAEQPGPAQVILEELAAAGAMTPAAWQLRLRLGLADPAKPGGAVQSDEPGRADSRSRHAGSGDRVPWRGPVPERVPTTGGPPRPGDRDELLERPAVRFTDVGGMDGLKEQIRLKIVYPATHPEVYAAYGQRAGGGLLLYGPPGCGKTFLARATAGELGASFISIGIADVLDMWVGSSERNLHSIFETARRHAPTVLFFDEVDALAAKRSDFSTATGRHVINQFLAELDGTTSSNDGILVLGATNAPWHVDPAFRRPGRFDEVLFVPPPDAAARRQILQLLLRSRPVRAVDLDVLVRVTEACSGADLKGIVERATQERLAAALRSGTVQPLETADLIEAANALPPTTREWFGTVRNYVLYANQSGLYDPVKPYLG